MAAGSHLSYSVPQPIQPADGVPRWTSVVIQRAPDDGTGHPGSFSALATVVINAAGRWAVQYDDSDSLVGTEWYRHHFVDAAGDAGDDSDPVQVNEFTVILWALQDIPDSALTSAQIKQWVDQALVDLWPDFWIQHREGIAVYDRDGDGVIDEYFPVPTELEEVCRVEKVRQRSTVGITGATNATPVVVTTASAHGYAEGDTVYVSGVQGNTAANGQWKVANKTGTTFELLGSVGSGAYTGGGAVRRIGSQHVAWCYMSTEWAQFDREVRVYDSGGPSPVNTLVAPTPGSPAAATYDYVLHGKQRLRDVRDLNEAWFQLVYWRIRASYLDWRVNKRADFVRFLVFDTRTDTRPEQLRMFLADARAEVAKREAKLAPPQFPYDISPGEVG